ncbi:hypothetical protein [Micrococcus luteus]|uniref:hypothetical protein n=1 Tax=Micrococcus luteus TaxID=1270 RepID=UPI003688AC01
MKTPARLAVGMLAASGLLLTGCASDPTLDESWPEIRQKVVDAQSLRLRMEGTAADKEEEKDEPSASASPSASLDTDAIQAANVDLAGATDDSHLQGTMNVDMGGATMDIEVLRRDADVFFKLKADGDDVLPQMSMFSTLVGDRWIKTNAEQAAQMDISLQGIMSDLEEDMPAADVFDGKDLKAEEVELEGKKYLKYALPEEHHEFGRTMLIDPESTTLYRLEDVNSQDDDVDANATFTEWNAVEAPEAPAAEDVLDLAALQQELAG